MDHRCLNAAVCQPWLEDGRHGHTCLCPHGFYDDHCSTRTTFSFSAPGFVLLRAVRAEPEGHAHPGFGAQLRFRTTLPNMVLMFRGDADAHLLLEIVDGGLQAKAFSEDSEMDVRFTGLVSDGDWRGVHVFLDGDALVLVLKGPGCDGDGCKVTDVAVDGPFRPSESFSQIYVGGVPPELLAFSVSGTGFTGCLEDLVVDATPFLPQTLGEDERPELGCSKTDWCETEPCFGRGRCVDLWTSYRCDCYRPFYGDDCSHGKNVSRPSCENHVERTISDHNMKQLFTSHHFMLKSKLKCHLINQQLTTLMKFSPLLLSEENRSKGSCGRTCQRSKVPRPGPNVGFGSFGGSDRIPKLLDHNSPA